MCIPYYSHTLSIYLFNPKVNSLQLHLRSPLYKKTIPNAPPPTTTTVAHPICIRPLTAPPVNGRVVVFVAFVAFGPEKLVLGMA